MSFQRQAFIMAGGSGERFWPVSTFQRPKQFLRLASPEATLLRQSVDRAAACVGLNQTHIATGRHLVDPSQTECPDLAPSQILAEPAKRNTAGCLIWVAANIIARNPDSWATTSVAILTADQRISPESEFTETVRRAMEAAEAHGTIVTIGIRPDRPETGFGYIELTEDSAPGHVQPIVRFREKPDRATAEEFLASGRFLWNSGMFFYTVPTFLAELEQAQPEMARATREIAACLAAGDEQGAVAIFGNLPSISIDFAVMEKSSRVEVVEATFTWDDLGSWDAIARSYSPDEHGNVALGSHRTIEASGNIVYVDQPETEVCLLGVENLVVVVSGGKVLICTPDRAQEVKKFLSPS